MLYFIFNPLVIGFEALERGMTVGGKKVWMKGEIITLPNILNIVGGPEYTLKATLVLDNGKELPLTEHERGEHMVSMTFANTSSEGIIAADINEVYGELNIYGQKCEFRSVFKEKERGGMFP